jgi:hypothetical protein
MSATTAAVATTRSAGAHVDAEHHEVLRPDYIVIDPADRDGERRLRLLVNAAVLPWVRSENWHPDELAARGRFEGGCAARRVAAFTAQAVARESAVGDSADSTSESGRLRLVRGNE